MASELASFVRALSLRMEAREAVSLAAYRQFSDPVMRSIAGAESQVFGKLREDLLTLFDGMSGLPAAGPEVRRRLLPNGAAGPWTAARSVLDPLWPGAVDAWMSMDNGKGEDDGYVPVWVHESRGDRPSMSALWAVHPDGDRCGWLMTPGDSGWTWAWRRLETP